MLSFWTLQYKNMEHTKWRFTKSIYIYIFMYIYIYIRSIYKWRKNWTPILMSPSWNSSFLTVASLDSFAALLLADRDLPWSIPNRVEEEILSCKQHGTYIDPKLSANIQDQMPPVSSRSHKIPFFDNFQLGARVKTYHVLPVSMNLDSASLHLHLPGWPKGLWWIGARLRLGPQWFGSYHQTPNPDLE